MENAFTNTALLERESFVCAERAGLWEKVKLLWVDQSLAASGENRLHNPEWRDVNDKLKRDLDFV